MTLFVYGTLQYPEIQELVTGRAFPARAARAEGFGVYCVKGATFPGLVREEGGQAPGLVLEDVSPEEMERLDAYEDSFYVRSEIPVILEETGESVRCQVYEVPGDVADEILSSERWTMAWFEPRKTDYLERVFGGR